MLKQSDTFVLLPTIGRPVRLRSVLGSLRATAPEVGCVVAVEPGDNESILIATEHKYILVVIDKPLQGCSYGWNFALRYAPTHAQAFVLGADDLVFKPGWFEETVKVLEEELGGSGLVGFNDEFKNNDLFFWSTHYLMTRDYLIEFNGGVMATPHYKTDYVDVEACSRAVRAGKFAKALDARVRHNWIGMNPDKAFFDSRANRSKSLAFFEQRKREGFPDDFQAVIR